MAAITGGVWPAVFSALTDDGRADLETMDRLVELFIDQKLDGLYMLGSTGQGPALRVEVRKAIAERVIKTNAGRIPVVVHVGAVSTDDAIELAMHAADCGADGISSVPPIYFPADVELTFEHYRRIASATDRPFLPYHAAFTGMSLPPVDEYARRVEDLPNIAGMKITDPSVHLFAQMRRHLDNKLILFSGFDEIMCQMVLAGADGAIGTWMNMFGPALLKVRKAVKGGDIEQGRRFIDAFNTMSDFAIGRRARFNTFAARGMKIKYDIDLGRGRTPMHTDLVTVSDEDVRRLIDLVDGAAGVSTLTSASA